MSLFRFSNHIFGLGLDAQELSVYAYLSSLPASGFTLQEEETAEKRAEREEYRNADDDDLPMMPDDNAPRCLQVTCYVLTAENQRYRVSAFGSMRNPVNGSL